jgi:predicted DNA repair protein MutK
MDAHLTVDLAEALASIRAPASYREDFFRFGEALADATPELVRALSRHGVDASLLADGGAVGETVDRFAGEGATSQLGFQVIRTEAWTAGQGLGNPGLRPLIRRGLQVALAHREWTLDRVVR